MENKIEDISVSEAFEAIENSILKLENDDISLEDSFEEYKKGIELIKLCSEKIEKVEKKVLKLKNDGETDEFE